MSTMRLPAIESRADAALCSLTASLLNWAELAAGVFYELVA